MIVVVVIIVMGSYGKAMVRGWKGGANDNYGVVKRQERRMPEEKVAFSRLEMMFE